MSASDPERPTSSVQIENQASNVGAQGKFYAPVHFAQTFVMPLVRPVFQQDPASTQKSNDRQVMLRTVNKKWIIDYLESSLYPAADPIWPNLGKEPNVVSQKRSRPVDFYPQGATIESVYEKADHRLLILGEPGSGKTILLLTLARILLKDAMLHDTHPMPVVFKLSSWAVWVEKQPKRQPTLDNWLIEELKTKYDIPERTGREWIKNSNMLPLLDGLDEMGFDHQLTCIRAINAYLQTHGKSVPIVVSCRHEDYFRHEEERILQLKAVSIQPFEKEQIDAYLLSKGEHLENLKIVRQAVDDYESMRELAENPLMLSVITEAYDKVPVEDLAAKSSLEAQRRQIFETYVNSMFSPPGGVPSLYGQSQTKQWLEWLANQLAQHSQTEFRIERIQPDWLPNERWRLLYRLVVSIVGGLIGAVLIWQISLLFLDSSEVLPFMAMGGLIGYLITFFASAEIKPAEALRWSWVNLWRDLPEALVIGMVSTPILGLINYWLRSSPWSGSVEQLLFYQIGLYALLGLFGIVLYALVGWVVGLIYGFSSLKLRNHNLIETYKDIRDSAQIGVLIGLAVGVSELFIYGLYDRLIDRLVHGPRPSTDLPYDLSYGFVSGLASGLFGGVIFGLSHVLSGKKLEERKLSMPNQGIRRSAYNSMLVGLLIGLFVGLIVELLVIQDPQNRNLVPASGLLFALAGSLVSGLSNGGFACIQHIFLRLFLWCVRSMPLRYAHFLDYASDLKLLRKVGGGYVFLHSLLQEYFVSQHTTPMDGMT